MRNWNLRSLIFHLSPFTVASLPMRNWNGNMRTIWLSNRLSCEPSYEELKQIRPQIPIQGTPDVASLPMRNWNIVSLFLILLLNLLRAFLWGIETDKAEGTIKVLDAGCEPSYEELKQEFLQSQGVEGITGCEPSYEELKLSILNGVSEEREELRAFLWGIETRYLLHSMVSGSPGCEPSYEELKLAPGSRISWRDTPLRAFLWGIKTLQPPVQP